MVRDLDIQKVYPEQDWKCKAYFLAVPYGWSVYIKPRKETNQEEEF
jgi:hypothetical protein